MKKLILLIIAIVLAAPNGAAQNDTANSQVSFREHSKKFLESFSNDKQIFKVYLDSATKVQTESGQIDLFKQVNYSKESCLVLLDRAEELVRTIQDSVENREQSLIKYGTDYNMVVGFYQRLIKADKNNEQFIDCFKTYSDSLNRSYEDLTHKVSSEDSSKVDESAEYGVEPEKSILDYLLEYLDFILIGLLTLLIVYLFGKLAQSSKYLDKKIRGLRKDVDSLARDVQTSHAPSDNVARSVGGISVDRLSKEIEKESKVNENYRIQLNREIQNLKEELRILKKEQQRGTTNCGSGSQSNSQDSNKGNSQAQTANKVVGFRLYASIDSSNGHLLYNATPNPMPTDIFEIELSTQGASEGEFVVASQCVGDLAEKAIADSSTWLSGLSCDLIYTDGCSNKKMRTIKPGRVEKKGASTWQIVEKIKIEIS